MNPQPRQGHFRQEGTRVRGGRSATGEAAAGGWRPARLALHAWCRAGPSAALSLAWGWGWARPPRPPLQPPSLDPSWRSRALSVWPGSWAVTHCRGAWPAFAAVRTALCSLICPPLSFSGRPLVCRTLGGGQVLEPARSCVCQTGEPWAGERRHLLPQGHTCTSVVPSVTHTRDRPSALGLCPHRSARPLPRHFQDKG